MGMRCLRRWRRKLGHAHADRGVDGTGGDHVDADLVLDQLDRRGARELVEAALGGDIREKSGAATVPRAEPM